MPTTRLVCLYADRHGCGDREAHPYICSGGPVCDLHRPGAGTTQQPDTQPQKPAEDLNSNTVSSTAAELPDAA